MITIEQFAERAIRVPFIEHGRDYEGWDCWGLVRCAYRDVYGIDLPSYADSYPDTGKTEDSRARIEILVMEHTEAAHRVDWERARAPMPGMVAMFRMRGRPIHVGIMIDRDRFLHADEAIGTAIERLSSPAWSRRIEAVYHHVG